MLLDLEVESFALLDRVQLEFSSGFNVLTGETGAGKSIVLDALGFLLGSASRDTQTQGRVAARFSAPAPARALLEEWGFDVGEEVLLSREISAAGRSACRINQRLATVANLRELGACLVEIHGQHQSTSLQRPSKHLELLDRMAGSEHLARLEQYRAAYRHCRELAEALEELDRAQRERVREIEWLSHELQEIDSARPVVGEEEELQAQVRRLAAAEELSLKAGQAVELLRGERGACDQAGAATRLLTGLVRHDAQLEPLVARLEEAEIALVEVARELLAYQDGLSGDPALLDELQSRLELLKGLKRKYGADIGEVLAYAERNRQRQAELENAGVRSEQLQKELQETRQRRDELARQLSSARRLAAGTLTEQVHQELAQLGLTAMRFSVQLSQGEPGPSGQDNGEFYLSANPGNPPRPLAKVASGGELSRLMLALISLFSAYDPVPTLVFDEIDAGLGGRAAEAVARRLGSLAEQRQILCVTHLAVIAAAGTRHVRVSKEVGADSTQVRLEVLQASQREEEVARMLSGDATPQTALQHARDLLREAAAAP